MKALMLIADAEYADEVERILCERPVSGYTLIPDVLGCGERVRRRGTRAFPGSNNMYWVVVADDDVASVGAALRAVGGPDRELNFKLYALNAQEVT